MSSLTSIGTSASLLSVVLPFCGVVVAGLIGWFGARHTAIAPLQASLNDAFRTFMKEAQDELVSKDARILELESEIIRQRGVINSGLAREAAMLRILEKNGIMPPEYGGHR